MSIGVRLLRWGAVLGCLGLLALAVYLAYLDRIITGTFDGRRWSVPAVVFAEPLELYPGATLTLPALKEELLRLGYRQQPRLDQPGTFKRTDQRLDVSLRAFRFMERNRESQQISVEFAYGGGIRAISDRSGRPVPLIRLDPLNIGSFFPTHGEDRIVLAPEDVPALLTGALVAVEDANYADHLGFSLRGIARAAWVNLTAGEIRQGGSTLTQQLVKSYYLDNRRTLTRKLREVAMAVILELRYSKSDLLNAYVNEIYLGQDGVRAVHGFGLGAQFYFNKPLSELEVHELATLVAIIRGPSYYNPQRHAERTRERRNLVLNKMLDAGLITAGARDAAAGRDLAVASGARSGGAYYPAFMDQVRTELAERFAEADLTSQGLRVFTSLAPRKQDAVEAALDGGLERLESARELAPGGLQGAVVLADSQTGEIKALAGGRQAGQDGFNRALKAARPVGSLLKPVVYLSALERGYHLASPIEDAPVSLTLRGQDQPWEPSNFDGQVHGTVPLVRALGDSLNLATVNLGLSIGVDQISERLEALTARAPRNRYPSLLLGAEPMTPLDVLTLYSNFASLGFAARPKAVIAVLDERGNALSHHPFALEAHVSPAPAAAMNRAMELVMTEGTGRSSRHARAGVAGKTGTSDDYRDSWFVGYDAAHLAVVWLGYDDNASTGLTGAAGALRIWDEVYAKLGVTPLASVAAPDWREVEYATGLLANNGCAEVVSVPVPRDAVLQAKDGCGISLRNLSNRLRRTFEGWFDPDKRGR